METICAHCKGSGKQTLSEERERCLVVMARIGAASIQEIHKALKSRKGITATHQIVRRLMNTGAVKRIGQERPMRFGVG